MYLSNTTPRASDSASNLISSVRYEFPNIACYDLPRHPFFVKLNTMTLINRQHPPPSLLLNQHFSDMGTLGEAIGYDLDFRQLEAGRLDARIVVLAGPRNTAMRVDFNRKFHQRGCPPAGMLTFGFADHTSGPVRWNNHWSKPGALLNFNEGRLEGVNAGNFGGYTLSFSEGLLQEVAQILGFDLDIRSCVHAIAFWDTQNIEQQLRGNLRFLEHAALANTATAELGELGELGELFNFGLAACVVRILAQDNAKPDLEPAPFRMAALKRALLLIEGYDQHPLTIADLCKMAGASWATLDRAFTGEFGMTPKAYMQARRLNAVRQQLIKAAPGTLIADVANRWNFWHMGRFAADYYRHFGELPSQTLQFKAYQ